MAKQILRFDRRDVQLSLRSDGVQVVLADGICREAPGAPAIPGRMLQLALPAGQRATRVDVRVLSRESLMEGPVQVAAQGTPGISALAKDAPAAPRRGPRAPDPELYLAAKTAPVAELRGMNLMGSVPVASVFVRPIRIGDGGGLELVTTLELSIRTTADSKLATRRAMPESPRSIRYMDVAARLVVNPEKVGMPAGTPSGTSGTGGTTGGMPAGAGSGGALPGLAAVPVGAGPKEVDYLIITDNHVWDAGTITPGAALGDIVGAFAPLVTHKKGRGLRSHIATVTDIVNGVYGDHRSGARDLQEVLRRFLQAYCYSRGVEWVLIGGTWVWCRSGRSAAPARTVCLGRLPEPPAPRCPRWESMYGKIHFWRCGWRIPWPPIPGRSGSPTTS
jgi:Peptidase family C25